jgi:hypothetical protein
MKTFFATMNFVRAVMLLCVIAALALGYLSKEALAQKADLQSQVTGVDGSAARVAQRLQQKSVELDVLQKQSAGFSYEELQNAAGYAREIATRKNVLIGLLNVGKSSAKDNVPGSTDLTWPISPKDSQSGFKRDRISNFFYMLEVENPFVVVTEAEFIPVDRSKDFEFASDRWTFKAEIMVRTPAE